VTHAAAAALAPFVPRRRPSGPAAGERAGTTKGGCGRVGSAERPEESVTFGPELQIRDAIHSAKALTRGSVGDLAANEGGAS
jgi:hypothetical protein